MTSHFCLFLLIFTEVYCEWCTSHNQCYQEFDIPNIADVSVNQLYSYQYDNHTSVARLFDNDYLNDTASMTIFNNNPVEIEISFLNDTYVTVQYMSIIGNAYIGGDSALNNLRFTSWSNLSYSNHYDIYEVGPCPKYGDYNETLFECMPVESYYGELLNWYTNKIYINLYMHPGLGDNNRSFSNISIYELKFFGSVGYNIIEPDDINTTLTGNDIYNDTVPLDYCIDAVEEDKYISIIWTVCVGILIVILGLIAFCPISRFRPCCSWECYRKFAFYFRVLWRTSFVIVLIGSTLVVFFIKDINECNLNLLEDDYKYIVPAIPSVPSSVEMYQYLYIASLVIALCLEIFQRYARYKKSKNSDESDDAEPFEQQIELQTSNRYSVVSQPRISKQLNSSAAEQQPFVKKWTKKAILAGMSKIDAVISLSFTIIFMPFYVMSKVYCYDYEEYPDLIDYQKCEDIDDKIGTLNYYYIVIKPDVRIITLIQVFVLYIGCIIMGYFIIMISKRIDSMVSSDKCKNICDWILVTISVCLIIIIFCCCLSFIVQRIIMAIEDYKGANLWNLLEIKTMALIFWLSEIFIDIIVCFTKK